MLAERSNEGFDVGDRISRLPNSILGVILSFLVTEEAVATSVLSRRWKSVWMSVPCFDFHFHFYKRGNKYTEFIHFVHHVMDLNTCSLLNKFNLVWYPKYVSPSVTDTWINIAITKNVRLLSLRPVGDPIMQRSKHPTLRPAGHLSMGSLCCEYDWHFMCRYTYVIPSNVFCCESLNSLELIGCVVSIDDQTEISLPNLESLMISLVTFKSDEAWNMILSGCPIVKFLYLDIVSHGDFDCTISSDTLLRLELCFNGPSLCRRFNLKKAPALEYLRLKGGFVSEISISDTSLVSLVEAHLDIDSYYASVSDTSLLSLDSYHASCSKFNNSIVEAVGAFHFVKVLTQSFDALQALAESTISLSADFTRLVKLVAGTCNSIKDFIYRSDNLQVLIIQKDEEDSECGGYFKYQSKRNSPEDVPRCLSNSLKEVRIIYYDGLKVENELIQFILQHGCVLETMEISFTEYDGDSDDSMDAKTRKGMFKLKQKIRRFPRKSPTCKVRFSNI